MLNLKRIITNYAQSHVFGPHMALAYPLDAILQGPKNSQIPGPNPHPLTQVMDIYESKTLCTGLYKS
jgi:hypothetical protein